MTYNIPNYRKSYQRLILFKDFFFYYQSQFYREKPYCNLLHKQYIHVLSVEKKNESQVHVFISV